jgi:transposase-like protein
MNEGSDRFSPDVRERAVRMVQEPEFKAREEGHTFVSHQQ